MYGKQQQKEELAMKEQDLDNALVVRLWEGRGAMGGGVGEWGNGFIVAGYKWVVGEGTGRRRMLLQ